MMKSPEFYRRAREDAAFRREKLEELRYFRNVGAGLIGFCLVFAAGFSTYTGVSEGRWDSGAGLVLVAALAACSYSNCATRIAALEAFEAIPETERG